MKLKINLASHVEYHQIISLLYDLALTQDYYFKLHIKFWVVWLAPFKTQFINDRDHVEKESNISCHNTNTNVPWGVKMLSELQMMPIWSCNATING